MKEINALAKKKTGNIEGWEPYFYKNVAGGMIIKGCMTRVKESGKLLYLTSENNMTVALSNDELSR